MKLIKKTFLSVAGVAFLGLGLIFVIVPGPSLIFLVLGLLLLSFEYPLARKWLKSCQGMMRRAAALIDKRLLARKYRR